MEFIVVFQSQSILKKGGISMILPGNGCVWASFHITSKNLAINIILWSKQRAGN